MLNITVIAKESHNILQQTTSNEVRLTENSVVVLKVEKEDVISLSRIGTALVVTLKNGETITIENYFNDKNNSDNSIVFEDNDRKLFVPEFTSDGVIVNYNLVDSIEPLLYQDSGIPILPWLAIGGGAGVIAALVSSDTNHEGKRDSTPPSQPTIDPIEADKKDPITGIAEVGSEVKVTYPNGTTETITVSPDGTWSVPNPGLEAGAKVTAVVTDTSGNVSPSTTATVGPDVTAPVLDINPIESGSKAPITGTSTELGAVVTVKFPDGTTATTTVQPDGTWSVPNSGNLVDGVEVKASITDVAGNTGTVAATVGPDVTVPTAPSLVLAVDTGSSATDGITSNGTVNVSGIEAGATWKYSTDGGTTWLTGTGTSFSLPAGVYSAGKVLVQQIDVAGNVSNNGQLPATTEIVHLQAVDDVVNTFSSLKTENTQKTYVGSSIGAVLVEPDAKPSFWGAGTIDAYGDVSGVRKASADVIHINNETNYATITVDAKSIFTLDYYFRYVVGKVKIVVYKQVDSNWVAVSSGNTYTSSNQPLTSKPAHISIYNNGDTSANYAVALEQLVSISTSTNDMQGNIASFQNSNYTHTQVNIADNKLIQTSTIEGNVLTNDKGATFASAVLKVNSTNVTGDQTIISGKYGILRMDADGDYTYVLNSDVTRYDLGKQDVFTYTLDDSAQSNVTANLTFIVNAQGIITSSSNVMNGTDRNYTESINETYVSGNDLFLSSSANETINGGTGNDTLIYNLLDNTDPTGGNGRDVWNNFTVAKATNDNTNIDFIDVHGLLSDKEALSDTTILQFLSTTTNGSNTTLYIDRDGGGAVYSPTALLVLNNVKTTIDELIKNHQILY